MSIIPESDRAVSSFHVPRAPIRKLFTSDLHDDSNQDEPRSESFQVFLRIKPHHELNATDCIKIVDSQKLVCRPPTSSKQKKAEKVEFAFSRIFGPQTSQKDLFNDSVVPFIDALLGGRNSLIFTYGTTNAGKTYTVQGSTTNPGIIPRTLHTLFSNIRPQRTLLYKPITGKNLLKMSSNDQTKQDALKQEIFTTFRLKPTDESSQFMMMLEESFVELNCNMPKCEVWISFVELYNETPHDLLTNPVKKLGVAEDKHHNFYVKDLRRLQVRSAEEAFMCYQYGKKNLCIASTKLNDRSSRSHCIFTVQVVNVEDPKCPTVSNLSICDLAGTERQTKAQNEGTRLKESGGINSSLFQLNRCLRTIRENQTKNLNQPIPYRYSNLTKLFRSALDDRTDEKILMIVNINPSPQLYDETQQVLKMCAIASKIKNKPIITKFLPRSSRFSTFIFGQETASLNDDDQDFSSDYEEDDLSADSVEGEIDRLKEQLALKDAELQNAKRHTQEVLKIYENLQSSSTQHIKSLEKNYYEQRDRYDRLLKDQKKYYQSKLHDLKENAIREETSSDVDSELLEKNLLIAELQSKLEMRTSVSSTELQLLTEVREKTVEIESLTSLLQEAKTEYIKATDKCDALLEQLAELEREHVDKGDLAENLEQELAFKQNIIEELESQIETLKQVESDNTIAYESSLVVLEKQRDKFKEELEHAQVEMAKLKDELERAKTETAKLEDELECAKTETAKLQATFDRTKAELNKLQLKLEESDTRASCAEFQLKEIERKNATIRELESVIKQNESYAGAVFRLQKELEENKTRIESLELQLVEVDAERVALKLAEQHRECVDKEQTRRYPRRTNRTPLSKSEKENKENRFFNLESPLDSARKPRKIRTKEKTILTDVDISAEPKVCKEENKENKFFNVGTPLPAKTRGKEIPIIELLDDSTENSVFRCGPEKTFADNLTVKDTPHGGKKKLFSTPTACDIGDLISLDSAERTHEERLDGASPKSKAIREVTTPAQTIKSALRSKKKEY